MKTGVVYIKIRLQLEYDLDESEVQDLVENVDYEVKDGKKRIQNTEIVAFSTDANETI